MKELSIIRLFGSTVWALSASRLLRAFDPVNSSRVYIQKYNPKTSEAVVEIL